SGALARTAELKLSVCQPLTATTARAIAGTSSEDSTNGSGLSVAAWCGLSRKKSISSSSLRVGAMYLRCCRTKNPCNSKYSRTIVSLTAAIPVSKILWHSTKLRLAVRGAECGLGRGGPCGWFRAGGPDRGLVQHFFDEV